MLHGVPGDGTRKRKSGSSSTSDYNRPELTPSLLTGMDSSMASNVMGAQIDSRMSHCNDDEMEDLHSTISTRHVHPGHKRPSFVHDSENRDTIDLVPPRKYVVRRRPPVQPSQRENIETDAIVQARLATVRRTRAAIDAKILDYNHLYHLSTLPALDMNAAVDQRKRAPVLDIHTFSEHSSSDQLEAIKSWMNLASEYMKNSDIRSDNMEKNMSKYTDLGRFPLRMDKLSHVADPERFVVPIIGREDDSVNLLYELKAALAYHQSMDMYKKYRLSITDLLTKAVDDSLHSKMNMTKGNRDEEGHLAVEGFRSTETYSKMIDLYNICAGMGTKSEDVQLLFSSALKREFNLALYRFRRNAQDRENYARMKDRRGSEGCDRENEDDRRSDVDMSYDEYGEEASPRGSSDE